MLGPFTFCMTKKMHQPEKVYIGSLFIIHGNISKILCHMVYSVLNKHAGDFCSIFYKHSIITITCIRKTLQYNINLLRYKSQSFILKIENNLPNFHFLQRVYHTHYSFRLIIIKHTIGLIPGF